MTSQTTPLDYPNLQNIDNGCDTLRFLWAMANKDFDITHPGITGLGSRVMSFVEMERIPVFMQIAALKCWEERNRVPQQQNVEFPPMPFPGPDAVGRAKQTKVNVNNSGSSSSSGSSGSK